ncbi:MAG: hypothetical protein H6737_29580 [Alphaproteobacteria bacterium]|nr:hypothetical protein [Alphaproteobacteria bacterium]
MAKKQTKKRETREEQAVAPANAEQKGFEKPKLQKLGQLPQVTTAFGGSFSP